HALADVAFLKQLAHQGRHFLPRFSSRDWLRAQPGAEFTKTSGVYRNLGSEPLRLTYTLPRDYPNEAALGKIPRPPPWPLLLVFHDEQDLTDEGGDAERFPGAAALKRLHPKGRNDALYDGWFLHAPAAPRARWLEPNGDLRHRFSTSPLREFWQHYDVDFDRIVIDGRSGAAAMAAAFPLVFAGLVLRGGEIVPETVVNYAAVPVFVVDDPDLADGLRAAGHPDVTEGGDRELAPWIERCRRKIPTSFEWCVRGQDHVFANWIAIDRADFAPDVERTLEVETLDTPEDPNTLQIDARGVEAVEIFLNDDLLDLDRDVRLVVNGEVRELGRLERSLSQLFEKAPSVLKSMYFGWLYPVRIARVPLPRARARGEPSARLDDAVALSAQEVFVRGRPDLLEAYLGPAAEAETPRAILPFALRDLWWRPAEDPTLRGRARDLLARAHGLLARQLAWTLGGGEGPYPTPQEGEIDPWPALTTVVLDRLAREREGLSAVRKGGPEDHRPPPQAWNAWYPDWKRDVLDWTRDRAYGRRSEGVEARPSEEEARADRRAEAVRLRNAILALLLLAVFVGGTVLLGRRLGERKAA
ncbi:MAG: hypothetical protein ACC662_04570, partial [Planctomycetota bacterium]